MIPPQSAALLAEAPTVEQAAQALAAGALVAFPTETVYGLGADALNDSAVKKIFLAKGRPENHPLIVHIASADSIAFFARALPRFAQKLVTALWPGPLTVILPRQTGIATQAAGGHDSIGLRCPSHPVALALLRRAHELGVQGVAAPSANRFGRISPTCAAHVRQEFEGLTLTALATGNPATANEPSQPQLWVLDGGDCDVGIESTIVDCTRAAPVLLRPGMHTLAQLSQAAGERVYAAHEHSPSAAPAPKASGSLASHYAPRARLTLISLQQADRLQPLLDGACQALYRLPLEPAQAAHELFAKLRELDRGCIEEIFVTAPPPGAAWDGVRDRLQRAAIKDGSERA